jgi:hypothetical protein
MLLEGEAKHVASFSAAVEAKYPKIEIGKKTRHAVM